MVEKASVDEETLMNTAIEAGADDFKDDGEHWEILTSPDMFNEIREAIVITGVQPVSAEIAMLPQNLVKVEGKAAQQIVKLMDVLEDQDDVQHVWSNFDIDLKEIEASLAGESSGSTQAPHIPVMAASILPAVVTRCWLVARLVRLRNVHFRRNCWKSVMAL